MTPNSKPDTDRDEEALLGGILRWPAVLDDVSAIVSEDMFRQDKTMKLFSCMMSLHGRKPIDLLTIAEELRRRGEWEDVGSVWLAEIWDGELTGGHAVHHAGNVRDAYLRRSLAYLAVEMEREAATPSKSAVEAVEDAERALWGLSELGVQGQVSDLVPDLNAVLDGIGRERTGIDGLPTGYYDLDKILGGFQKDQLVIIGARPATGKTALGLSIARKLTARDRIPIFFASLEQSRRELAERLLAGEGHVNGQDLRAGVLSHDEVRRCADAASVLRDSPLYVDDCATQTVQRIAANARRLRRSKDIQAVVIDYLQLITPDDKRLKRYEQVGQISRRLKILARELSIPVICLAQLNRGTEDHKEPRLSDLRDSGDIEQDADTVLLMHRSDWKEVTPCVPIDIIVAKHRNGPTGRVTLMFDRPSVTFVNAARGNEPRW